MRHTKILATLGPASDSDAALDQLIASGVDVVRLNFSHGSHETHRASFQRVRAASARARRPVAVLQDLSGPKIRIGPLRDGAPIELRAGDTLRIVTGTGEGSPGTVYTAYAGLARSVRPGDRLLLDDGRLELRVESADGQEILARVVFGGLLAQHKGINAPGVPLPASALTAKDEDDLRFGLALGVDLVALSFVQTGDDLRRARAILRGAGRPDVPLVAKIERPLALQNLDDVLRESDGVMIARGDLGLELPLEQVPRAQKEITRHARRLGLPVIVATQVLDSMRTEPRPTRAEVSDAANAVDDGVDAIMLAGETAVGVAPARAVQTLVAIIEDAESAARQGIRVSGPPLRAGREGAAEGNVPGLSGVEASPALCEAAVTLATLGHADALVAVTRTGRTARMLSALRPCVPVYALTASDAVARRLSLYWGVVPVTGEIGDGFVPVVPLAGGLVERGLLPAGRSVVIVSVDPDLSRADTNFLKLQRL